MMRYFTYFGYIETNFVLEKPKEEIKVTVVDNFSSKIIEFALPVNIIEQIGITEQHVLFLDDANSGYIWLYKMNTEEIFVLPLGLPSQAGIDDEKNLCLNPPIFLRVKNIIVRSKPLETNNKNSSKLNGLEGRFSHWNEYQKINQKASICSPPANRLLTCTTFGAFLVINYRSIDFSMCSVLRCLYRNESPLLTDEFVEYYDGVFNSVVKNSIINSSYSFIKMPFHVKKLTSGYDHLALLNPLGHVYTIGTGTKGELGHGCIEQGQWMEPKIVSDLADFGIHVTDLASSAWHNVVLTDDGDIYGWGWNGYGQLGISSEECSIQTTPYPFDLPDIMNEKVEFINCIGNNSFVKFSNGINYCFGELSNSSGMDSNEFEESTSKSILLKNEPDNDEPSIKRAKQSRSLNIAVAGCSHGQMDIIYDRLINIQNQTNKKIDLLLCCGDFQAIRNYGDLHYFHAPPHHRKLGTFYKYYSGEKIAPILTLFIGGNHESSGFMAELPYGGWVSKNIWYMGYSSVIQFAGLRIVGLSGIFKSNDYNKGHFERPPFQEHGSIVSAYHVRSIDIFRLKQLKESNIDICLSHDWPSGITDFGDCEWLLKRKPYFAEDIHYNRLGNPATMNLLHQLKPLYWFAAHLHIRFTATVIHNKELNETNNTEENNKILINSSSKITNFLALDKPMGNDKRRKFLELIDIPISEDASLDLSYDPMWLAILKTTDHLTKFTDRFINLPNEAPLNDSNENKLERSDFRPTLEELETINNLFSGDFRIPLNFQHTAPPEFEPWTGKGKNSYRPPSLYYRNPQSQQFCEKLGIQDLNYQFAQASLNCLGIPYFLSENVNSEGIKNEIIKDVKNPEEIDLEEDEFGTEDFIVDVKGCTSYDDEKITNK